jgi:RNA 2',3'-cyclic 3'-phosphodiesterase
MRVFVAVEIDEAVRGRAAGVSSNLSALLAHSRNRRSVAWVAPANLHVTLQFLGDIDASRAKEVADRLAPPLSTPSFDVAIAGLGTFPASGPPRVVWLGVTEGAAQVSAVYREVALRLDGLGFPRDARPFHPHLTLGRVRTVCDPGLRDAMAAAVAAEAGRCRVDHVTLFESRLSPSGAVYSVVGISRLGYHQTS